MDDLAKFRDNGCSWFLEEFAELVNQLLPNFLDGSGSNKVTEHVNPRSIRNYTSLGLIDEPHKSGKYAQYHYRHLVQILAVKKLLAQGYGTTTIERLLAAKSDRELESLLTGGVELQVQTTNPALDYLERLRSRKQVAASPAVSTTKSHRAAASHSTSEWVRLEILPGLEIHIRSDFAAPASSNEENSLYRSIIDRLKAFFIDNRK
jgi:DNA-binding transcriptional MerR regulator